MASTWRSVDGNTVYGDGVNVAARLEGLAESGGIMVSGNVFELVRNRVDCLFACEGRKRVRNIPEPITLYAIVPGHERASFLEKGRQHKRHIVAAGVVAGVLVLAGAWYAFVPRVGVASGEIVPLRIFRDCPDCPELVEIPPGIYERGSRSVEPGHLDTESPVTRVTIKRSFAIGRYPVTFGEWDQCVREGACKHKPNDRGWGRGTGPVFYVNWNDTRDYLDWLKVRTGKAYRLLSEAEWEYAARAGTRTAYPWGDMAGHKMANCKGCSDVGSDRTVPVGSYPPNRYNLFDMHGNVWQWVADCWNASYAGAPTDGSPWFSGARRRWFAAEPGGFRLRTFALHAGRVTARTCVAVVAGFASPASCLDLLRHGHFALLLPSYPSLHSVTIRPSGAIAAGLSSGNPGQPVEDLCAKP